MSPPVAPSTASTAAATSIRICVARISLRRSTRSPSAPAGIARISDGMLAAAWIAPINSADLVSEIITHCAATVCIHEPMLLTNCAVHSRRNAGVRRGLQPEPSDVCAAERCGRRRSCESPHPEPTPRCQARSAHLHHSVHPRRRAGEHEARDVRGARRSRSPAARARSRRRASPTSATGRPSRARRAPRSRPSR